MSYFRRGMDVPEHRNKGTVETPSYEYECQVLMGSGRIKPRHKIISGVQKFHRVTLRVVRLMTWPGRLVHAASKSSCHVTQNVPEWHCLIGTVSFHLNIWITPGLGVGCNIWENRNFYTNLVINGACIINLVQGDQARRILGPQGLTF